MVSLVAAIICTAVTKKTKQERIEEKKAQRRMEKSEEVCLYSHVTGPCSHVTTRHVTSNPLKVRPIN